jgi:hypothetical protein
MSDTSKLELNYRVFQNPATKFTLRLTEPHSRYILHKYTFTLRFNTSYTCETVLAHRRRWDLGYVFTLFTATKALRESRGIALICFYTSALEGSEGSASRPGRFLPPGKTQYPLYRRLSGPQSRYGQVRKISPLPEFDPRTVQPVASRYTDWATRPTSMRF